MNQLRKFWKSSKALSPVVATVMLIAIAVAVSVATAGWLGGMSFTLMGNAEQARITNTVFNSPTAITITIQNTGSSSVTIENAHIDGNATAITGGPLTISKGTSGSLTLTPSVGQFTPNTQYTTTLSTAKSTTLFCQATYNP
jgi:archaeal type IV pilus assembly protein PilA